MTDIFLKFVNMGIAAGWLVLAVIVLRIVLRKAPKWLMLVLWGIVALRLALPVSIQSIFSLIPSAETISPSIVDMQEPQIHSGITALNTAVNPVIMDTFSPDLGDSVNPLQIVISVTAVCWIAGIAAMLFYAVFSYWRLYNSMRTAVMLMHTPMRGKVVPVYQSEFAASPFVLGIVCPRIYLPYRLTQKEQEYVIAHEQAHIRNHDHWWKPIGFLLLSLYWYNPVIWAAYVLFCRDIELACDERVVRELDAAQRADYSEALLSCSAPRRTAACPLAFGETGVTVRVKNVLHYKKPAFWVIVVAVLACIAVAVCFLTDPRETAEDNMQWAVRPTILMNGSRYIDPNMPASKLPYGYEYAGTLDSAQANDTGLEGCAYYTSPYNPDNIYVYQECKTPVGTHEMDSAQWQWMYQQWLREGSGDGKNRLTLEEVQRLCEFGGELTWTDFEQYDSVETGSGLYIQVYEIDEMFSLWIGGGSKTDTPMYIYLQTSTEPVERVEIRTQDVSAFIGAHLGAEGTGVRANVYQIQFPAHTFDKTEYNIQIFEIEPFTLQITLPEDWSLVCPQDEEEAGLGGAGGFSPVLIYEGDQLLGSICYNTFEVPKEGEYGVEYVAIYNQLMLGAHRNWNNEYQVVTESGTACTAACKICVDDPETGEEKFYQGILSYDKELGVYIAIDFIAGELGDEAEDMILEMAESILLLHGRPQK